MQRHRVSPSEWVQSKDEEGSKNERETTNHTHTNNTAHNLQTQHPSERVHGIYRTYLTHAGGYGGTACKGTRACWFRETNSTRIMFYSLQKADTAHAACCNERLLTSRWHIHWACSLTPAFEKQWTMKSRKRDNKRFCVCIR